MARVSIFVIIVALVGGTMGCAPVPTSQYDLTISSTEGGSVSTPGEETFTYYEGEVVELVAKADEGYVFDGWTGDVDTIADVNAASTTIMMNGDYSITADFARIHDLIISSTTGGSVTTPGEGTFSYAAGTMVDLVAVAHECYEFAGWSGDVVSDSASAETAITMDAAKTVTASFALMRHNLTIDSTDGGSVPVPSEGSFSYDCGIAVTLLAEPGEGYLFARWTGHVDTIADVNAAATTITMNANYSVTADFVAKGAVYFADRNLEAVVRAAIGEPAGPIYPSALQGLTSLSARQKNISDLTGLQHCIGLTLLDLGNNQVRDISPLASLTKLTGLDLGGNWISDISMLAGLTNLTWLVLWGNDMASIIPLADLTNLTGLNLGANQIRNISSLANLTSLTWLSLDNNQVSDISPLTSLTKLTDLNLWGNQIVNISPLTNLTSLTSLDLGWNQIVSTSPLADLASLSNLELGGNQITNISSLVNLVSLTWLGLSCNEIIDLAPLANLTSLIGLDLGDANLGDISALADLTNLTELVLDSNSIGDVSPLANLVNLTRLSLWSNHIDDISSLANLMNLTLLNLGCNQIDHLSPLTNLTGLTHLYLNDNQFSDVSPLADLTSLVWLSLWANQIGDLAPLENLTSLTVLELGGNQIADISPLVQNEGLSEGDYIDLRWNPLGSDSISICMPELEARGVKFNPEFPIVETCPCLLDTDWIQNPETGNYYALTVPMSWMAAEGCAQALGGHLATLNSWEEESWIRDVFGRDEELYIGFSVIGRQHHEDNFVWSSGEPVIYTNWASGEPNNYRGEDVAVINAGEHWNDLSRHGHHRALIEVAQKPG